VFCGLLAFFLLYMAWQGFNRGAFSGRLGHVIRKEEQPVHFWLLFSFLSGFGLFAAYLCATWKKRGIAMTFPEK
jgi:hypothetical protein